MLAAASWQTAPAIGSELILHPVHLYTPEASGSTLLHRVLHLEVCEQLCNPTLDLRQLAQLTVSSCPVLQGLTLHTPRLQVLPSAAECRRSALADRVNSAGRAPLWQLIKWGYQIWKGSMEACVHARRTSSMFFWILLAIGACLGGHLLTWVPLQGLYVEECKQLTRLALQSIDMDSVALGGCPSLNQLTLRCPNLQMLDLQYGPCCSKAMHMQCCPCPANLLSTALAACPSSQMPVECLLTNWISTGIARQGMPPCWSMQVCQSAAAGPEPWLHSPATCFRSRSKHASQRHCPVGRQLHQTLIQWPTQSIPETRSGVCRGCGDLEMVQGSCPRLHMVDAQFCHVLGNQALDSMAACMPTLQSLLLPYCTAIACTGLAALAAMQGLHTLDLSFSKLKVDGCSQALFSYGPCLNSWQSPNCVPACARGLPCSPWCATGHCMTAYVHSLPDLHMLKLQGRPRSGQSTAVAGHRPLFTACQTGSATQRPTRCCCRTSGPCSPPAPACARSSCRAAASWPPQRCSPSAATCPLAAAPRRRGTRCCRSCRSWTCPTAPCPARSWQPSCCTPPSCRSAFLFGVSPAGSRPWVDKGPWLAMS